MVIVAVSVETQIFYEVANVGSGPAVDFTINLKEGTYVRPVPYTNSTSTSPQPSTTSIGLPAGKYIIYYSGFNAYGPYNFEFTLNGETFKLLNGQAAAKYGYVWNHGGPEPSIIEVVIGG
ncbi:hypothetical protein [uncultured Aquimarina sp.]|uniref:hypothetical protein n=1 Tax=uncultured Aquimarina sp. TaxID=575652 RepID=UPI0026154F94|nr:hypothetical protein [uncultured Aquimarina sp.]